MIRRQGLSCGWAPVAAAVVLAAGLSNLAAAQQTTIDPYKPYIRGYQAFSDPGATMRPGFPNPLGGSGRPTYGNVFDPNGQGYGGFDPFAAPYFNRFQSPSLNRGSALFHRSVQDLSNRPERLVDPQERLDREFYENLQKRDDPYVRLQEKRDDLYFRALQETNPQKRAELLRAYQKASQRSSAALSSPRRSPGASAVAPTRRDLGTGGRTGTKPAPGRGSAVDRPDSLKDALERSDAEDRASGLPPPSATPPPSSVRRNPGP